MLRVLPLLALLVVVACSDDDAAKDIGHVADTAPPSDTGSSPGKIGDPCASDGDCEHNLCRLKRGTGIFPGGYCSKSCDAVNNPCPAGAYCVGTADGDCFKLCSSSSECRSGYSCTAGPGVGAPTICFPS